MFRDMDIRSLGTYLLPSDRWFLMAVIVVLATASIFTGYFHALDHDLANNAFGIAFGTLVMTVSLIFQWRLGPRVILWLIGFIVLAYGGSFLYNLNTIHAYISIGSATYAYFVYVSPLWYITPSPEPDEEKS